MSEAAPEVICLPSAYRDMARRNEANESASKLLISLVPVEGIEPSTY